MGRDAVGLAGEPGDAGMVPPRDGRVVFDIGGNKFRLVAWINFHYGVVDVRFIGTHRAYDAFDAQAI